MKEIKVYGLDVKFSYLTKVWNAMQKSKAKQAISSKDRAKTSLTHKELLNKYAQLGGILQVDNVTFTFEGGFGCLTTPKGKTLGAVIDDFLVYAQ